MASRTSFCTTSAGRTREATAITRSLGTARGGAQAGQGGGERLAGHEQHVVAEQKAAPQAGSEGQQAQGETDGGAVIRDWRRAAGTQGASLVAA